MSFSLPVLMKPNPLSVKRLIVPSGTVLTLNTRNEVPAHYRLGWRLNSGLVRGKADFSRNLAANRRGVVVKFGRRASAANPLRGAHLAGCVVRLLFQAQELAFAFDNVLVVPLDVAGFG